MSEAILPQGRDFLQMPDALDRLCDDIIDGQLLADICKQRGIAYRTLTRWINAEPVRAVKVKEARRLASYAFDEKAENEIRAAKDDLDLKKAKELAHHYRWRASKMNPGDFGDKIEVGQPGDFSKTADDELANRLEALLPGSGALAKKVLEGGGNAVH